MAHKPFSIVGHRGWPQRYPENSLPGLLAAAEAGAKFVELDVQISADGVPMVFHDATLTRVTGKKGYIWDFRERELKQISCHEPRRLGDTYRPTPIVSLAQVCAALAPHDLGVFIEIKEESFAKIDRVDFLARVIAAAKPLGARAIIISFDKDVLALAKAQLSIGWVLRKYRAPYRRQAIALGPDYLICDVKKLPRGQALWSGPWRWFVYDVVDPTLADYWAGKGVDYIETWDVGAFH